MVKMMTMEEWQAQLVNLRDDLTDEDGEPPSCCVCQGGCRESQTVPMQMHLDTGPQEEPAHCDSPMTRAQSAARVHTLLATVYQNTHACQSAVTFARPDDGASGSVAHAGMVAHGMVDTVGPMLLQDSLCGRELKTAD